jgi:uncharacterized protein (UPF0261 family)
MSRPTAAIVATLDTKSEEVGYLIGRFDALGIGVLTVDCGIRGEPGPVRVDVSRHDVAARAGTTIPELLALPDRGPAIEAMMRGLAGIMPELYAAGRFDRIIAVGGFNGALLGASAMQGLPFGVPKLIVSPIASGERTFGTFVGYGDVTVMHSVVDVQGLNSLSRRILATAAAMVATCGLPPATDVRADHVVAMTVNGNTTPVATLVTEQLRARGWEVVPFHSNGAGGGAMERLLAAGEFDAVVDLTTNELAETLLGGLYPGAPDRLLPAARLGIPAVVVPGCLDFTNQGPVASLPARFRGRPISPHNPEITLVRPSLDDALPLAEEFGRRVGAHPGPIEVVIPEDGLSMPGSPGGSFYDPAWNAGFVEELRAALPGRVPCVTVPASINTVEVARAVVDAFDRIAPVVIAAPVGVAARVS